MARRVATIHIYDSHEFVVITGTVHQYEGGKPPRKTLEYRRAGRFPSTGKSRPADWLGDALLHLATLL